MYMYLYLLLSAFFVLHPRSVYLDLKLALAGRMSCFRRYREKKLTKRSKDKLMCVVCFSVSQKEEENATVVSVIHLLVTQKPVRIKMLRLKSCVGRC
jgi:hypothetical protein